MSSLKYQYRINGLEDPNILALSDFKLAYDKRTSDFIRIIKRADDDYICVASGLEFDSVIDSFKYNHKLFIFDHKVLNKEQYYTDIGDQLANFVPKDLEIDLHIFKLNIEITPEFNSQDFAVAIANILCENFTLNSVKRLDLNQKLAKMEQLTLVVNFLKNLQKNNPKIKDYPTRQKISLNKRKQ